MEGPRLTARTGVHQERSLKTTSPSYIRARCLPIVSPSRYSSGRMKPHGTYKIRHNSRPEGFAVGPVAAPRDLASSAEAALVLAERADARLQRLLDSLREEILEAGESCDLRIRRVFVEPREIFRLELARPEFGYQRTTLLERDALEELLESDAVRAIVETQVAEENGRALRG